MIKTDTLILGAYQTNCYLAWEEGSGTCAVIDPGYEPEVVSQRLKELGLTPDAILLTHGHFDHVGAVEALAKAFGCSVWIHEGDWVQTKNPISRYLYPLTGSLERLAHCREAETLTAGGLTFQVLHTPGHTPGSVCYLCQDAMFCGDTLFAGSCGRTDLPGGDQRTLFASLERLAELEQDYRVFPGHGGSTTLRREQATNPYLRGYV